ncbi:MAG TPA: hypothetical protein VI278_15845 [Nitrososphaeraceae archaeon]
MQKTSKLSGNLLMKGNPENASRFVTHDFIYHGAEDLNGLTAALQHGVVKTTSSEGVIIIENNKKEALYGLVFHTLFAI